MKSLAQPELTLRYDLTVDDLAASTLALEARALPAMRAMCDALRVRPTSYPTVTRQWNCLRLKITFKEYPNDETQNQDATYDMGALPPHWWGRRDPDAIDGEGADEEPRGA